MKLPAFEPRVDWRPPDLSSLPSWREAKRVAVDIETCDSQLSDLGIGVRRGGYITGIAFAIEDGPKEFLPVQFRGGDNLPREPVMHYLRDQAKVFRGDLVGAKLDYDLDYLAEDGIKFMPRFFRDVRVAEALLDDLAPSYSLDAMLKRYGYEGKVHDHIEAAYSYHGLNKSTMWQLPGRHVAAYALGDVTEPLALLRRQERRLEDAGLWDLYNLESRLILVLLKMRRRGVRIDFDRLDQVERWALAKETEALSEVTRLTGIQLTTDDTTKAASLAPCLEKIGVRVPLTPKTKKPSVDNPLLESVDHDIARHLLVAKKFNKLRCTFVSSVRRHATGGRIHCSFNQVRLHREGQDDEKGTRYGRLSCVEPNLQQQPARDPEIGPVWRSIYVPDEGGEWLVADYSQQEPRWVVHFAETSSLTGRPPWPTEARDAAIAAAEAYRRDPNVDHHDMMSRMADPSWDHMEPVAKKVFRDRQKQNFLGLCYGKGEVKLCREMGFPLVMGVPEWSRDGQERPMAGPEGREFFEQFHAKVPYVRELSRRCQAIARRSGHVKTVLGRTCHFPLDERGRYDWIHKALNRLIQGSSGDQTKKAMVDAEDAGLKLQLQVHDELDKTIGDRGEANLLAEVMREAVPCRVPHKIDLEAGPSWGEVKKI